MRRLRFICDRSLATLDETTPQFNVEISFDNGEKKIYNLSLGGFGKNVNYVDVLCVGAGYEMTVNIIEMDKVGFLLTGIQATIEELTV